MRFTPRKQRSKWSEINRTRAGELIAATRMAPAGLAEINAAKADGRWDAGYAPASAASVPDDFATALDALPAAGPFLDTLTGANRYAIPYRIADGKRLEPRTARIAGFVALGSAGERLH